MENRKRSGVDSSVENGDSSVENEDSRNENRDSRVENRDSRVENGDSRNENRDFMGNNRTSNFKPRTSSFEPRSSNFKPRTSNFEPRTSNFKPRTSNSENRSSDNYKKPHTTSPKPHASSLVFGVQAILESLKSGKEIERILVQREFGQPEIEKIAKERDIPFQRVPAEKLNRITTKNHQGLIAFVSSINYAKLSNVIASIYEKGEVPLILVLDRITDVRNFGAIARTAECAGVHTIVVPSRNSVQINADAMKTSSGALNYLPVCRENSLSQVLEELQQSGIQVIACTEKAEKGLYEIDYSIPTAILMGSEEDGISENLLEQADFSTKIPMIGQIGSLNVSVATGVILYEVVRQRTNV